MLFLILYLPRMPVIFFLSESNFLLTFLPNVAKHDLCARTMLAACSLPWAPRDLLHTAQPRPLGDGRGAPLRGAAPVPASSPCGPLVSQAQQSRVRGVTLTGCCCSAPAPGLCARAALRRGGRRRRPGLVQRAAVDAAVGGQQTGASTTRPKASPCASPSLSLKPPKGRWCRVILKLVALDPEVQAPGPAPRARSATRCGCASCALLRPAKLQGPPGEPRPHGRHARLLCFRHPFSSAGPGGSLRE